MKTAKKVTKDNEGQLEDKLIEKLRDKSVSTVLFFSTTRQIVLCLYNKEGDKKYILKIGSSEDLHVGFKEQTFLTLCKENEKEHDFEAHTTDENEEEDTV